MASTPATAIVVAVESTFMTVRHRQDHGQGDWCSNRSQCIRSAECRICPPGRLGAKGAVRMRCACRFTRGLGLSLVTTSTADPLAALSVLPGVAEVVAETRSAVDRLRAHKVLRSRSSEVTAESALRGARASAAIAGADWPLEELRRRTDLGDEQGAGLVRGALRISGELSPLLGVLQQAPAQALTRMHMLAAAGEVEGNRIG